MRNVPEIRIAGYDDAWEQRKLEDIASFSKGSGYSKSDLKSEGCPAILYGRLYTNYETEINEVDTFVEPKQGTVYSQGNEVIIPASGETAEDISRASFVTTKGIILGGDLNIVRPNKGLNPGFLALLISHGSAQKELSKKAQGKSVVHIHNSDIEELEVSFPSVQEQERISDVFRSLDNLLTLHQRKYDKLKATKAALMQKMFPKEGESVPELRFPGFTDAWEQRKFGSIVYRKAETAESSPTLPGIEYEDINSGIGTLNKDPSEKVTSKRGVKFSNGDVLFGKLRPYLKNWYLATSEGVAIGDFWVLNSDVLKANFLFYIIQAPLFQEIANTSVGTKMPRADWGLVSNSSFAVPADKKEQDMIGQTFASLDNLLTLHQRECEKLQEVKKALLEKMFPGGDN